MSGLPLPRLDLDASGDLLPVREDDIGSCCRCVIPFFYPQVFTFHPPRYRVVASSPLRGTLPRQPCTSTRALSTMDSTPRSTSVLSTLQYFSPARSRKPRPASIRASSMPAAAT